MTLALRPWIGFAVLAAVLLVLTPANNGYDGPLRLASALLHGRTHLSEFIPWIEMFRHDGRDYVAYPPMVSFVLVPYAWVTRGALGQPLANTLLILGSAFLLHRLFRALEGMSSLAPFAVVAYALATPNLYSAHNGNVWLLMHSEGNFFLLLALVLVVRPRRVPSGQTLPMWRLVLAGLSFMTAVQTRHVLALAAPVFGLLFLILAPRFKKLPDTIRAGLWFSLGVVPPLVVALVFQWWTLGDPWMSPYQAGWREWGLQGPQFAFRYLDQNLPVYTWAHPTVLPEFPYLRFDLSGQSIFVMSPFFLGLFALGGRLPWVAAFLPSVVAMTAFYLVYFGSGYAQFGARYMQDLYPLLIPLALSAFARPGRGWRVALVVLLVYSILLNAYGVWVTMHYFA
jgi:hypothetical protein